jgi:hypothetical protein
MSMPGQRVLFLNSRITANVAAPIAKAVQFALPPSTEPPIAHSCLSGPSLGIEKPNSFGSWLIKTVSAIPFI